MLLFGRPLASNDATGDAAVSFGFSEAATGTESIPGTAAVAFGFSESLTGTERFTGTAAVAFGFSEAGTAAETMSGSVAEAFGFAIGGTGGIPENVSGTAAAAFGFSLSASGIGGQEPGLINLRPGTARAAGRLGSGNATFTFGIAGSGDVTDDDLVLALVA